MIEINKESNTIIFTFSQDESFNENILNDAADNFKLLKQQNLNIVCNGFIPLELCMYISNVSKFCEMTIDFVDDSEGQKFLEFLSTTEALNIKFKKKENNG